jgi:hypothetical protein
MIYRIREFALAACLAFAGFILPEQWDGLRWLATHVALVLVVLILLDGLFDALVWAGKRLIAHLHATRGT